MDIQRELDKAHQQLRVVENLTAPLRKREEILLISLREIQAELADVRTEILGVEEKKGLAHNSKIIAALTPRQRRMSDKPDPEAPIPLVEKRRGLFRRKDK